MLQWSTGSMTRHSETPTARSGTHTIGGPPSRAFPRSVVDGRLPSQLARNHAGVVANDHTSTARDSAACTHAKHFPGAEAGFGAGVCLDDGPQPAHLDERTNELASAGLLLPHVARPQARGSSSSAAPPTANSTCATSPTGVAASFDQQPAEGARTAPMLPAQNNLGLHRVAENDHRSSEALPARASEMQNPNTPTVRAEPSSSPALLSASCAAGANATLLTDHTRLPGASASEGAMDPPRLTRLAGIHSFSGNVHGPGGQVAQPTSPTPQNSRNPPPSSLEGDSTFVEKIAAGEPLATPGASAAGSISQESLAGVQKRSRPAQLAVASPTSAAVQMIAADGSVSAAALSRARVTAISYASPPRGSGAHCGDALSHSQFTSPTSGSLSGSGLAAPASAHTSHSGPSLSVCTDAGKTESCGRTHSRSGDDSPSDAGGATPTPTAGSRRATSTVPLPTLPECVSPQHDDDASTASPELDSPMLQHHLAAAMAGNRALTSTQPLGRTASLRVAMPCIATSSSHDGVVGRGTWTPRGPSPSVGARDLGAPLDRSKLAGLTALPVVELDPSADVGTHHSARESTLSTTAPASSVSAHSPTSFHTLDLRAERADPGASDCGASVTTAASAGVDETDSISGRASRRRSGVQLAPSHPNGRVSPLSPTSTVATNDAPPRRSLASRMRTAPEFDSRASALGGQVVPVQVECLATATPELTLTQPGDAKAACAGRSSTPGVERDGGLGGEHALELAAQGGSAAHAVCVRPALRSTRADSRTPADKPRGSSFSGIRVGGHPSSVPVGGVHTSPTPARGSDWHLGSSLPPPAGTSRSQVRVVPPCRPHSELLPGLSMHGDDTLLPTVFDLADADAAHAAAAGGEYSPPPPAHIATRFGATVSCHRTRPDTLCPTRPGGTRDTSASPVLAVTARTPAVVPGSITAALAKTPTAAREPPVVVARVGPGGRGPSILVLAPTPDASSQGPSSTSSSHTSEPGSPHSSTAHVLDAFFVPRHAVAPPRATHADNAITRLSLRSPTMPHGLTSAASAGADASASPETGAATQVPSPQDGAPPSHRSLPGPPSRSHPHGHPHGVHSGSADVSADVQLHGPSNEHRLEHPHAGHSGSSHVPADVHAHGPPDEQPHALRSELPLEPSNETREEPPHSHPHPVPSVEVPDHPPHKHPHPYAAGEVPTEQPHEQPSAHPPLSPCSHEQHSSAARRCFDPRQHSDVPANPLPALPVALSHLEHDTQAGDLVSPPHAASLPLSPQPSTADDSVPAAVAAASTAGAVSSALAPSSDTPSDRDHRAFDPALCPHTPSCVSAPPLPLQQHRSAPEQAVHGAKAAQKVATVGAVPAPVTALPRAGAQQPTTPHVAQRSNSDSLTSCDVAVSQSEREEAASLPAANAHPNAAASLDAPEQARRPPGPTAPASSHAHQLALDPAVPRAPPPPLNTAPAAAHATVDPLLPWEGAGARTAFVDDSALGHVWLRFSACQIGGQSKSGAEKQCQDVVVAKLRLGGLSNVHLFAVCDGHGPHGHFVAAYVGNRLPVALIQRLRPLQHGVLRAMAHEDAGADKEAARHGSHGARRCSHHEGSQTPSVAQGHEKDGRSLAEPASGGVPLEAPAMRHCADDDSTSRSRSRDAPGPDGGSHAQGAGGGRMQRHASTHSVHRGGHVCDPSAEAKLCGVDVVAHAIAAAINDIEQGVFAAPGFDASLSGTTLVMALVVGRHVIVANVGDSRCVLGYVSQRDRSGNEADGSGEAAHPPPRGHSQPLAAAIATAGGARAAHQPSTTPPRLRAKALTTDQTPADSHEHRRVRDAGGVIGHLCHEKAGARVEGADAQYQAPRVWNLHASGTGPPIPGLAMTRSVGDEIAAAVGVISAPIITHRCLQRGRDVVLVLASDGVWDVMRNEEAVLLAANAPPQDRAALVLCQAAEARWDDLLRGARLAGAHVNRGRDDISAVVLQLLDIWSEGDWQEVQRQLHVQDSDAAPRSSSVGARHTSTAQS